MIYVLDCISIYIDWERKIEGERERQGEIALIVYAHFMYWRRVDQFGFTCATNGFFLAPGSRGFDRLQVGEVMSLAHPRGYTPIAADPNETLDIPWLGSHGVTFHPDLFGFLLAMAVDVELFSYERNLAETGGLALQRRENEKLRRRRGVYGPPAGKKMARALSIDGLLGGLGF